MKQSPPNERITARHWNTQGSQHCWLAGGWFLSLADQQRICDLFVSKTASKGAPAVTRCSAQHHRSHSQTPARFFLTGALPIMMIPEGKEDWGWKNGQWYAEASTRNTAGGERKHEIPRASQSKPRWPPGWQWWRQWSYLSAGSLVC